MEPHAETPRAVRGAHATAMKVAVIYFLAGAAWIFLSDWVLAALIGPGAQRLTFMQTTKGLLFVAVTTLLLYLLLFRALRRMVAEQVLRHEAEMRLRPFIEHLPGVVFLKGLDGRVLFAGGTMDGLRLDPAECFGKTSFDIWDPDQAQRMEELDRQILAERKPKQLITTYRRQGVSHWLVHKFPVMDDWGEPIAVGGIGLDITPRIKAEEEARRLNEELQRADALKDQFLSTLSHELRAPLTSIRLWAHLLRSGDEETRDEAIEMIDKGVESQARIIGDLLDISKIISGTLKLEKLPVDLPALVRDAAEAHRPVATAAGLTMQVSLKPINASVAGDARRLKQVLGHLLSNAIKFTPPGGRIHLSMEPADAMARLTVRDTGKGIDPQYLPHLFERFSQADSSLTRAHGGLGVGLAIVRHLVELHGGRIRACSGGDGEGATFEVELPLTTPGQPVQQAGAEEEAVETGRILQGVNVLVVEDSPETLQAIGAILRQSGAGVQEAATAQQALESVRRSRPEVLLADIGLPEMDGCELIRRVRESDPDPSHPIKAAALSGYAAEEDRRRALDSGFDLYIAKPVEPLELVTAVAALAGKGSG